MQIRPDTAYTFTSGSRLEADTTGEMDLGSQVQPKTPVSVAGTLEVRGAFDAGGDNSSDTTAVTVESGATVTDLGGEQLVVNGGGILRVQTSETDTTDGTLTDTLRVGKLQVGQGRFFPSRAVVATGETRFTDNTALFESDGALVARDTLRWQGGTLAGPDTVFAERGFTLGSGFDYVLDQRRLVVPGGERGVMNDGPLKGRERAPGGRGERGADQHQQQRL